LNTVVVVAGPTASGKTDVAVRIAEKTDGEIISADSMQIYKYMDIGTAKPNESERRRARHHMIDIVLPDENFNVAQYQTMARACIDDALSRGKVPVLAGGTGFYINAALVDFVFDVCDTDGCYRQWLYGYAEENGAAALHAWLEFTDPASHAAIHPNNVRRVARALEFFHETGKRISDVNAEQKRRPPRYDARVFILEMDREKLYGRIDARAKKMIEDGLIDETAALLKRGYGKHLPSMRGLGYKEATAYLDGACGLDGTAANIQQATRNYAKLQMTWFKLQLTGERIDAAAPPDATAEKILEIIEKNN